MMLIGRILMFADSYFADCVAIVAVCITPILTIIQPPEGLVVPLPRILILIPVISYPI